MEEKWEGILETNNKYEVSNMGRIRTIDHYANNSNGGTRFVKGIIRKHIIRADGYAIIHFYLDGKRWSNYVHRLVWRYFGSGNEPNHKIVLDHIDNDKSNNRIDNLRLLSNSNNLAKGMALKKGKKSRFTGAYWRPDRNHWFSTIKVNDKKYYLGSFDSEVQAGLAYLKAKLRYTGELGIV